MGISSSYPDNESLLDALLADKNSNALPHTHERALRLVDRGHYTDEHTKRAYTHLAWRSGVRHLSSAHIYITVLQHLDIQPAQRFLNIGSGSGFFNTVVGLLLG